MQSYLNHHGDKLAERFDPGSYLVLTETMNTHDIGRGRGGVLAALQSIEASVIVGGVDTDRLYPLYQQAEIAAAVRSCDALEVIRSVHGHAGFLIEAKAVGDLVQRTTERGSAAG